MRCSSVAQQLLQFDTCSCADDFKLIGVERSLADKSSTDCRPPKSGQSRKFQPGDPSFGQLPTQPAGNSRSERFGFHADRLCPNRKQAAS